MKKRTRMLMTVILIVVSMGGLAAASTIPMRAGVDFITQQEKIAELSQRNLELESQVTSLTAEITTLTAEHSALQTTHIALLTEYKTLQNKYNALIIAEAKAKAAAKAKATAVATAEKQKESKKKAKVIINKTTPPPAKAPAGKKYWSKTQVVSTLTAAAKESGLNASQTSWVVNVGARIAYKESTYNTQARNGQHLGLFQFNNAWGPAASRLNPVWSCYRFVRVYKEGGERKIRQHWAATY